MTEDMERQREENLRSTDARDLGDDAGWEKEMGGVGRKVVQIGKDHESGIRMGKNARRGGENLGLDHCTKYSKNTTI